MPEWLQEWNEGGVEGEMMKEAGLDDQFSSLVLDSEEQGTMEIEREEYRASMVALEEAITQFRKAERDFKGEESAQDLQEVDARVARRAAWEARTTRRAGWEGTRAAINDARAIIDVLYDQDPSVEVMGQLMDELERLTDALRRSDVVCKELRRCDLGNQPQDISLVAEDLWDLLATDEWGRLWSMLEERQEKVSEGLRLVATGLDQASLDELPTTLWETMALMRHAETVVVPKVSQEVRTYMERV
jgi:hypothetical protein